MPNELREKMAGDISLSNDPGKTMRKWREEFSVSQNDLASAMDISPSVISDYESGRRKSPGVGIVRKFVETLIEIDVKKGSLVISKFKPEKREECIIAMDEFEGSMTVDEFVKLIKGVNLNPNVTPTRRVCGYTVVNSIKAIMSLSSTDYLKIYGWSTERALIFTDVHYGRSPMIAIRAHPLTPSLVVYLKPDAIDPLAVKLAELERICLVSTDLGVDEIKNILETKKKGI